MENIEFAIYDEKYSDVVKEIEKEMFEERKETNLAGFDKKSTRLAVINNTIIGYGAIVVSRGIATLQYGVLKKYRGQGFGGLILNALTNKCFNIGYDRAELLISPKNIPSMKLAEKAGYYRDYTDNEFNPDNEEAMYYTYYKNNYRKIR